MSDIVKKPKNYTGLRRRDPMLLEYENLKKYDILIFRKNRRGQNKKNGIKTRTREKEQTTR